MNKLSRLAHRLRERGLVWTTLHVLRRIVLGVVHALERLMIGIEKKRRLTGEGTVSSSYHTVQDNRRRWETYDWTQAGEEWTLAARHWKGLDPERWKRALIDQMMKRYLVQGWTILEIGPGAGRWSEHLRTIAGRLILADITEKCLAVCRDRFSGDSHIEYHLIGDAGLCFLARESIDAVWSYDVFVHINPTDIERYLGDLREILKPGAIAVIHHSGTYRTEAEAEVGYRSHMDARFFAGLAERHGFDIIEQNETLPHKTGDVITVLRKPASRADR